MGDPIGGSVPPAGGSPGASGPAGVGPDPNAANVVSLPSTLLMVVAGIAACFAVLGIILNLLGVAIGGMSSEGGGEGAMAMMQGGIGILFNLVSIGICGFIIYGALQMKGLKNWTLALVANILAMIPCCVGACCLLGLPVGIWGVIVLIKPEIKAAFAKK